jgi:hypothetical protein
VAADASAVAYAVVEDVPASWADYEELAGIGDAVPDGLILHVAGPTDEGFRTIEIWESREAWSRFHRRSTPEHRRRHGCFVAPTRRSLVTAATVRGRGADGARVPAEDG